MSKSGAARFFAIPELVVQVVEEVFALEKPSTASRLSHIARNWVDPVSSRLWREQDTLRRLARVAPRRQQHYADKIRILIIRDAMEIDTVLPTLAVTFDSLEAVGVGIRKSQVDRRPGQFHPGHQHGPVIWPKRLISPTVKRAGFWYPPLQKEADLYHQLASPHFGALQELEMWLDGSKHADIPMYIVSALRCLHNLRKLAIDTLFFFSPSTVGQELLFILANMPVLEDLKIKKDFSAADASALSALPGKHFPALTSFNGGTTTEHLPHLLAMLPTDLARFKLAFGHQDRITRESCVITRLSSLSQLRSLRLTFKSMDDLAKQDWLALRHFTALERLHIKNDTLYYHPRSPHGAELDDETFTTLIPNLPALEHLKLGVENSLTSKSLAALGTHCRRLRTLAIQSDFDFLDVFDRPAEPPLFPRVEFVGVDALKVKAERIATSSGDNSLRSKFIRVVELLRLHLPEKVFFSLGRNHVLSTRLQFVFTDGLDASDDRVHCALAHPSIDGYFDPSDDEEVGESDDEDEW